MRTGWICAVSPVVCFFFFFFFHQYGFILSALCADKKHRKPHKLAGSLAAGQINRAETEERERCEREKNNSRDGGPATETGQR